MARRRKRRLSRQETMMRLILVLAIIATFLVGGIVTYFGGHINLTSFVILVIVFMVVFATIGIVFSLPVVNK